jgi:CarD family transcriptional regulator, regulator of rRNA transcription
MTRRTDKSAAARRTPSQAPRGIVRGGAPAAKKAGNRKVAAEGVLPGMSASKKTTQRQGFKTNEFIVYPAHGVGQILAIEEQEVAGAKLELFVINFVKDKMTLRVPTAKIVSVGMRKLAEPPVVKRALDTLKGRARIKRTMWSRRAQEYEAKINSGDIVAIAEVVRDLYRSETQPEQSYSERQLYEAAVDRLSREIAAVQRITETEAIKEIEAALAKGPRRGPKPADEAEAEPATEEEAAA